MLTTCQFHQLAAAAWVGPAATIQVGSSSVQLAGHSVSLTYTVFYTVAGQQLGAVGCASPWAAVQGAIEQAYTAGVLSLAQVRTAQRISEAAEAVFAGAPAPAVAPAAPIVCAACGESEDLFQQCRCAYQPIAYAA